MSPGLWWSVMCSSSSFQSSKSELKINRLTTEAGFIMCLYLHPTVAREWLCGKFFIGCGIQGTSPAQWGLGWLAVQHWGWWRRTKCSCRRVVRICWLKQLRQHGNNMLTTNTSSSQIQSASEFTMIIRNYVYTFPGLTMGHASAGIAESRCSNHVQTINFILLFSSVQKNQLMEF